MSPSRKPSISSRHSALRRHRKHRGCGRAGRSDCVLDAIGMENIRARRARAAGLCHPGAAEHSRALDYRNGQGKSWRDVLRARGVQDGGRCVALQPRKALPCSRSTTVPGTERSPLRPRYDHAAIARALQQLRRYRRHDRRDAPDSNNCGPDCLSRLARDALVCVRAGQVDASVANRSDESARQFMNPLIFLVDSAFLGINSDPIPRDEAPAAMKSAAVS